MEIKSFVSGSVKVVLVEGEINRIHLKVLFDEFRFLHLFSEVLLDLTAVTFAGSTFVNLLSLLRSRHPVDFRKIKLINPSVGIRELLTLTQMDQLYPVFAEEEELCPVQ